MTDNRTDLEIISEQLQTISDQLGRVIELLEQSTHSEKIAVSVYDMNGNLQKTHWVDRELFNHD